MTRFNDLTPREQEEASRTGPETHPLQRCGLLKGVPLDGAYNDGSEPHAIDTYAIDLCSATSEVADIVVGTTLGLPPGRRRTEIEAVEMFPARTASQLMELTMLDSTFLNSFHSRVEAETLLMTDVDVTWQRSHLAI